MTGKARGRGISGRSNPDLMGEVATRAEVRIGRPGAAAGSSKHAYARRLLERYQRRYGNRRLETEASFKGGSPARYGEKGSVRLDVYDTQTGDVYDYKFTQHPGQGISQKQQDKIRREVPGTIHNILEVNPQP